MKKIIHVNPKKHHDNIRDGTKLPIISVKTDRGTRFYSRLEVLGPVTFIYNRDAPLGTGAICWAETEADCIGDGQPVK